jgi:hypothetical protein
MSGQTLTGDFEAAARRRPKRAPPFSLRLSDEERARLEHDAAGQSLGSYVRTRLFGGDASPRKRGKFPVKDHALLAALLGKLGASRMPNNLNQLARLANVGALPVCPEVEDELRQACAEIAIMKVTLLRALQIKED